MFHDAWPVTLPPLVIDIVNNHNPLQMSGNHQWAMLVLASEQLMPNVEAAYAWSRQPRVLSHLFIYHTNDEARSVNPAKRLQTFFHKHINQNGTCELLGGDGTPQSVMTEWRQLKQRFPDTKWVLNSTGGLKPMAAALMNVCGEPNVEVIYRELNSGWFRVFRDRGDLHADLFAMDGDAVSDLSVTDLIELQLGPLEGQTISSEGCESLNTLEITRHGCHSNWESWSKSFEQSGHRINEAPGLLFERFVVSALMEMGVNNICQNFIVRGAKGKALLEVDIMASINGKLFTFDCKLRSDSDADKAIAGSWIDQLQLAEERRRRLGGLNAKTILIRPNSKPTLDHLALAEAYNISVVGPDESFRFFSELAKLTSMPLSPKLEKAEALLVDRKDQNYSFAFSAGKTMTGRRASHSVGKSMIDVTGMLANLRNERDQDWSAYCVHTTLTLQIPATATAICDTEVLEALTQFGKVQSWRSKNKKSQYYEIRIDRSRKELLKCLDSYRNAKDLVAALVKLVCPK